MPFITEKIKFQKVLCYSEKIKTKIVTPLVNKYKTDQIFRHMLWITIINLTAHWFLLVVTGRWWDDWVYANKNWSYMIDVFKQSSLPMHAYINAGLWLLPDGFDKILTFFYFYIGSALLYFILRKIDLFSNEACLWVVLLYITVPINDARITWICYGYSLGLLNFWISFYLATVWKNSKWNKRLIWRIVSLVFLFLCFDTESIMIMTLLILGYFYYEELKGILHWKDIKKSLICIGYAVLHYLDYLFLPIIWYFGDKIVFPGYGVYNGHSYVHWDELMHTVFTFPKKAHITFMEILKTYYNAATIFRIFDFTAFLVCFIIAFYVIKEIRHKKNITVDNNSNSFLHNAIMTIVGLLAFFLGFFPYAVKRNTSLEHSYIPGRDSLLLGIGVALLLYYGSKVVLHRNLYKPVIISFIFLGIVYFNYTYLRWQESYYQQLQLQHAIAQSDEIKNNDTFLIMSKGSLITNNYYQINGNSWAATGEETRLFIPGVSSLKLLTKMDENSRRLNAYGMKDYTAYDEKAIDGIIFVGYSSIDNWTIFKQKFNELFDKKPFNQWIDSIKDVKYVPLTKEESDYLLQLFAERKLNDQLIYEMYYESASVK